MGDPASRHSPMDPPDFCNPSVVEERLKRKAEQKRLLDEAQAASRAVRKTHYDAVSMQHFVVEDGVRRALSRKEADQLGLTAPWEARERKAPPFVTMQSAPLSVPFTPAYTGYKAGSDMDHYVSDNGIMVRIDQMKDLTAQMQDVQVGLLNFGDRKNEGRPYGEISARRLGAWQRFLLWLFGEPAQKQLQDHQVRTFIIARQGFGGRGKQERTA